MSKEELQAKVTDLGKACDALFRDDIRLSLTKSLNLPDTSSFADIIKQFMEIITNLGPVINVIMQLFAACPKFNSGPPAP